MLTAWPVFISFLAELQLAAAQLVIFFGSIPLKVSGSRLPPLLVVGPDDCRVCSSRSTHAPNTTNNCNTPSSLSGKLCDCNVEKLGWAVVSHDRLGSLSRCVKILLLCPVSSMCVNSQNYFKIWPICFYSVVTGIPISLSTYQLTGDDRAIPIVALERECRGFESSPHQSSSCSVICNWSLLLPPLLLQSERIITSKRAGPHKLFCWSTAIFSLAWTIETLCEVLYPFSFCDHIYPSFSPKKRSEFLQPSHENVITIWNFK